MTLYVMPASFQELRDLITKIRADFVANIVKEGQFTTLDNGITFHYRERSGDALLGIFMQDRREPAKTVVYLAERGQVAEANGQSYLILEKGTVHRQAGEQPRHLDRRLRALRGRPRRLQPGRGPDRLQAARALDAAAPVPGREGALLHDPGRPLPRRAARPAVAPGSIPLALMLIAFAALGDARTTRQGRGTAVALAVVAVVALAHRRLCGLERGGPHARRGHRDLRRAASRDRDLRSRLRSRARACARSARG